jgi:hypothetical protein
MRSLVFARSAMISLLALAFFVALPFRAQMQQQGEIRGEPVEPSDASQTRAQMAQIQKLLPRLADRGAAYYFLAAAHRHLGETFEALRYLKKCIDLEEGFDPSSDPQFAGLAGSHDFDALVKKAQQDFPPISHSQIAFWDDERDLIPEGIAWDSRRNVFYLSSLNLRKIVQLTPDGKASDFVPSGRAHLLPILGIRPDASDGSVWAASSTDEGKSELLHFDSGGKLLGRFAPGDSGIHALNDLVITGRHEIFITDSLGNLVYRFDPVSRRFSSLSLCRPLFNPNGIALDDDGHHLFVADSLGVIRVDLSDGSSREVIPDHHVTLAGADGLYWYKGSLVAIQNGIGAPRVALFKLAPDASRVTRATILEYRTLFTELPTTGAIRGSDFYYISNSHVDNLLNGKIQDVTQLESVRIAVVHLP